MNDLSSSRGEGDQSVAKENGDVGNEELKRAESDVEKSQVESEEVEERSALGKQLGSGKKEQKQKTTAPKAKDTSGLDEQQPDGSNNNQKQRTTEPEAKDMSSLGEQSGGSKKDQNQKTIELKAKDLTDFSKQSGGGKKEDKKKETEAKTKGKVRSAEKKAQRNEVSKDPMDNKEDYKMKRKENELKEDEDNKKRRKEIKSEVDDIKRERTAMELKVHPEGNEQRASVSKKNKGKDEKLKEIKVKPENEGRKGQNQDGKKMQRLVESGDVGRKGHIEDGKKKQKVVDNGNDSENEKENGTTETTLYKFPMNRVSKIIRNEEFDGRISQEAIFLINKASEKFLELLAKEAYASAFLDHKSHISYDHLSSVICRRKRLDFLSDFVPEKVKGEEALKDME